MTIIAYAVPAFLLLIVLEAALGRRNGTTGYTLADTFASLAMGLGNRAVGIVTASLTVGLSAVLYEYRVFDLGTGLWVGIALFFAEDLCYYWFHRAHHEVRLLWAAHVNHHSSTHYNLSTALRQSWTTPLTGPWFWAPLAVLGFHPGMIAVAKAISLIYQFWLHTEHIDRLGPLEWVLNTPSHHRVHHGSNPQYLDKNYGGILIIWDRLFGTFEPEAEPVDYGLTENIESYNPVVIALHEYRDIAADLAKARNLPEALAVTFRSPAWLAQHSPVRVVDDGNDCSTVSNPAL